MGGAPNHGGVGGIRKGFPEGAAPMLSPEGNPGVVKERKREGWHIVQKTAHTKVQRQKKA